MKFKKRVIIVVLLLLFGVTFIFNFDDAKSYKATKVFYGDSTLKSTETKVEENYFYLSDLEYITTNCSNNDTCSYAGYKTIQKDKNTEGKVISLFLDGQNVSFIKGLGVHAAGQVVYDLSDYSDTYTRFVSKLGIDSSRNGNGNVKFQILVSEDATNWKEIYHSDAITSSQNALEVDLNIEGCKYLKIKIDSNGHNDNDHAVLADARIVKKDYDLSSELYKKVQKVSYYDDILSDNSASENYENQLDLVLMRAFVDRIGYWNIQNIAKTEDGRKMLDWLFSDSDNLKLVVEVGNIDNGGSFLNNLSKLYTNYSNIIGDSGDSYIYKEMLIALAASDSSDRIASSLSFSTWIGGDEIVERYRLIKYLYDNDLFARKEEFQSYDIDLIRSIMNVSIGNYEMLWLSGYTAFRYPNNITARLQPYNYMSYISPNYMQDFLYSEENRIKYTDKYQLNQYGIPYGLNPDGSKTARTWMVMEAGGICWNISRLGQSLYRIHGIPVLGSYQPSHEVYIYYYEDEFGNGKWDIGNNISGWGKSATSWGGAHTYRTLLNWANKPFTDSKISGNDAGNNSGYILLAQGALNDSKNYKKSYYYNLIADSYSDNAIKEDIYEESLNILDINLDSYEDLINLYKVSNKSSDEWADLALQVIDSYTYYPMAMVDLLKLIYPYLDQDNTINIDMLKTKALNKATKTTASESLQPNAIRELVSALLGENKVDLASFSFDGDNAGVIVMNPKYDDYDFQVQYSLDGGINWSSSLEHKISLSSEELATITADNDIQVKISGSNEVFVIDILNGQEINTNSLTNNDDEDIFVGQLSNLEYSLDNVTWSDYHSNVFEGNQIVYVKYKAHDRYLAGNSKKFQFTEALDDTKKYISVKNIQFVSAGTSQNGFPPENMIDANPFTVWHTKYGQIADDKSYIVSFDKVRYLSQISYDPSGVNGRIKNVSVYVSLDGDSFKEIGRITGWSNNENRKILAFEESMPAKYVKIVADSTYGNAEGPNKYVSGKSFNYYEDSTKIFVEVPVVNYSITSVTNQDVVATLQLPEGYKVVGDVSYTFSENGVYTFKYVNLDNEVRTIDAKVDWIDKIAPTAEVVYDTTEFTNFSVTATVKNISEDNVVILNSDDGTHIFYENGSFVFELQDEAGNIGYLEAKVDWIDNIPATAEIKYEVTSSGTVIASVVNPSEEIFFVDGNGSYEFKENGSHEFVFRDRAGNITKLVAIVNWINEEGASSSGSGSTDSSDNIIISDSDFLYGNISDMFKNNKEQVSEVIDDNDLSFDELQSNDKKDNRSNKADKDSDMLLKNDVKDILYFLGIITVIVVGISIIFLFLKRKK